jgi:hypothetical protein
VDEEPDGAFDTKRWKRKIFMRGVKALKCRIQISIPSLQAIKTSAWL